MQNALDAFRAQRDAADQIHARLTEVARLLEQLTLQVNAVAGNAELRTVLCDERDWLYQAQQLLVEVRHFREQERLRFWPSVWRRWALAVVFALGSTLAAAAGHAWWTEPYTAELKELREGSRFVASLAARMATMSQTERRELDLLLWGTSKR